MNWLRIATCDLRRIFKDKQIFLWWIIMPLGFAYLFGSVFGDKGPYRTWLPIFNFDQHELSQMFIEELKDPDFNIDIRSATDEHYIPMWSRAVIIPVTFSTTILAGEPAKFTFTQGKGGQDQNLAVQAKLVHTITRFTGAIAQVDIMRQEWSNETKEQLLASLHDEQLLSVEKANHFSLRPPPSGFGFTLPAYIIMFLLMNAIMYGGISLTNERKFKQLIRLNVAPLHPYEIFLGKITGHSLQPIFQACLLLGFGYLLMGVSLGDHPLALIPVIVCFSLCCGAFGIFFGALCKNEGQVFGFGIMLTMVFSAMGGCWWPLEIAPPLFKTAAMFTPTYWGLHALQNVMAFGKSWDGVYIDCLVLLTIATVLISISIPIFKRNQE
jgi:ABC-2 type transport system permease protein